MSGPWVVGVDLSLRSTGIAGVHGDAVAHKTPKDLDGMARIDHVLGHVLRAVLPPDPDLVVIEGYSFGSKGRATFALGELGGVVRHTLWRAGVRYLDVPPPTLKIFATGSGTADKTAMVVAARERLAYPGTQSDEADALWLRAFGYHRLGAPLVQLPKTHTRALDAVALPPLEDRCRTPAPSPVAASGSGSTPNARA